MRKIRDLCPKCGHFSLSFDTFRGVIRCTIFICDYVGPTLREYYAAAAHCEDASRQALRYVREKEEE